MVSTWSVVAGATDRRGQRARRGGRESVAMLGEMEKGTDSCGSYSHMS